MGRPAGECLESGERVSVIGRITRCLKDRRKALRRGETGAGSGARVGASVGTAVVRARRGSSGDEDAAKAIDGVEVFDGPRGARVLALPEAA